MMQLILPLFIAFTIWMCFDCIQRKEHIIWIIIMVALFPLGAIAYFLMVKSRESQPENLFAVVQLNDSDTEDTLQLKDLIQKYHKPYHYDKLGQHYLEKKRYDLALPNFQEALKREPDHKEARYGFAKALHGLGRFAEAAIVLEELIKADRKYDYGNAIFGLAECYRLAGQEDKALEVYETVINTYHFFKAYYYYARMLEKRGKIQEAVQYMKSIIASSKNLPDYKLEKERYWIEEAYKFLKKHGIDLA